MSENAITLTRTAERVTVHIPMTLRRSSGHRRIIAPEIVESVEETSSNKAPTKLAVAVAKAHQWQRWLDEGRYRDVNDLARALNLDWSYVHRLLRLTLLAPDIVDAIIYGREPEGLTLSTLRGSLPLAWVDSGNGWGYHDKQVKRRRRFSWCGIRIYNIRVFAPWSAFGECVQHHQYALILAYYISFHIFTIASTYAILFCIHISAIVRG